jgi:hypothetical protein
LVDRETAVPSRGLRKAIPATCGLHRGRIRFANIMVSLQGESIVLDPHAMGECVITLDEVASSAAPRLAICIAWANNPVV